MSAPPAAAPAAPPAAAAAAPAAAPVTTAVAVKKGKDFARMSASTQQMRAAPAPVPPPQNSAPPLAASGGITMPAGRSKGKDLSRMGGGPPPVPVSHPPGTAPQLKLLNGQVIHLPHRSRVCISFNYMTPRLNDVSYEWGSDLPKLIRRRRKEKRKLSRPNSWECPCDVSRDLSITLLHIHAPRSSSLRSGHCIEVCTTSSRGTWRKRS